MDLSIITVTWNSANFIKKQLISVQAAGSGLEFEQIVVDNQSSDETVKVVSQLATVELIKNSTNLGFAAANNQGVVVAKGEFILFLNPDMELTSDSSLKKMIAYLQANPKVGVLSCKLINARGQTSKFVGPRRLPKVWEQIAIILKLPHFWPGLLSKYYCQDLDLNQIQSVDTVRGAFMLVRRELITKLGQVFDTRFHLWFEDVDFCRRVKNLGYQIIYHPAFSCVDLVGQSFEHSDHLARQKQFMASLLIYFKKWDLWYGWIWILFFRPIGLLMTWLYVKLK